MNETNTIPGFHPRLMGALTGLMLLSGILSFLPAELPKAEAVKEANSVIPQKWVNAWKSARTLRYRDERGFPQVLVLDDILKGRTGNTPLNLDETLNPILDQIASYGNGLKKEGNKRDFKTLITRLKGFAFKLKDEAGNPLLKRAAPEMPVVLKDAAKRIDAVRKSLGTFQKTSTLGFCGPDPITGDRNRKCPV